MKFRRWLRARWVLGWALLKHVVFRPFSRGKADPRFWLRRLSREALGPTPPANWRDAAATSRCIGCGLCDALLPRGADAMHSTPSMDAIAPNPVSLSQILQGAARLPSDAPELLVYLPFLRAHAPAISQICPARVDAAAVADLIERNASALRPDETL